MRQALIIAGVVLVVLGLLWPWLAQLCGSVPFGRLPGDINVERPGFSFHVLLGTSLLISLVLSVLLTLIVWLLRR